MAQFLVKEDSSHGLVLISSCPGPSPTRCALAVAVVAAAVEAAVKGGPSDVFAPASSDTSSGVPSANAGPNQERK